MTEVTVHGSGTQKIAGKRHPGGAQLSQRVHAGRRALQEAKNRRTGDSDASRKLLDPSAADRLSQSSRKPILHADRLPSSFLDCKLEVSETGLAQEIQPCASRHVAHSTDLQAIWDRVEALRGGTDPEVLATKAGFSRATYFNQKSGKHKTTLELMEGLARALKVHLYDILAPPGLRANGTPPHTKQTAGGGNTGGVRLTENAAVVVSLMEQLTDAQQETVRRTVESTLRAMGFSQPTAPRSGAGRGRRTTGPKVRT